MGADQINQGLRHGWMRTGNRVSAPFGQEAVGPANRLYTLNF